MTRNILVADCGQVIWNMQLGRIGPAPYPVKAMGLLTLRRNGYGGGLVAEQYEVEFDSIGAAIGLGLDCARCKRKEIPGPYISAAL